jgi:hypothetical protein
MLELKNQIVATKKGILQMQKYEELGFFGNLGERTAKKAVRESF